MSVRTRTSRTRRAAIAVAAAALLPLGLAACGDDAAENAAEKAIEDANGGDVDVDIDGDNVKIEGSDGAVQYGSELPDDFPRDEVPLVGEVTIGTSSTTDGTKGWTVATTTDASPDDAFEEAKAALEDAGFAIDGIESGNYAQLKSDAYRLVLTASEGADGAQISYIVSTAD
ncbi:hypothetical protein [Nocardioides daeguensis]|uniref:Secreted protein n=1 Tax=Nocardioides daeguensis TaxID=908359 RepID=A0ABP6VFU5_9ACTN|nr:hypothetical protein [Nocardioides daeguensis]MBV6726026.1 hypothetical protein [Nocardioides daeguensis]MCR1771869.1 hypothetical protein [Nocardioides daeguensis]